MDEGGRRHPVHSFLLFLKFPVFRGLDPRKVKEVILDEVSAEVVELLIGLVYGLDR